MCQSGWRASLGMKSTSEHTFTSASAASERCFLISFSPALLAFVSRAHTTPQGQVFEQGIHVSHMYHCAGNIKSVPNEFDIIVTASQANCCF